MLLKKPPANNNSTHSQNSLPKPSAGLHSAPRTVWVLSWFQNAMTAITLSLTCTLSISVFPCCKVSYKTLAWLSDTPHQTVAAAGVDLSSGCHHLCLHPALQQYICFQMQGRYYCSVVLPFGWNLAPAFFSKFMHPVVVVRVLLAPLHAASRSAARC